MISELKEKLSALRAKRDEPETIKKEIETTEQQLREEEQAKKLNEEVQQEALELKQRMLCKVELTAKCPHCNKIVEMKQCDETLLDHQRRVAVEARCENPKCIVVPKHAGNLDLNKPLLYALIPVRGGAFRSVFHK